MSSSVADPGPPQQFNKRVFPTQWTSEKLRRCLLRDISRAQPMLLKPLFFKLNSIALTAAQIPAIRVDHPESVT